jgi:hypothetical protein
MSRIYFHTRNDEAAVYGSERAWMGNIASKITYGIMEQLTDNRNILRYIAKDCWIHDNQSDIKHALKIILSVGENKYPFVLGNDSITPFELCLNTAIVSGSDPIKMCARIHGQCEIHCYIVRDDFDWFSNIIKNGIQSMIFRKNQDWESVLSLIEKTEENEIVLSYSVCDGFPNRYVAGWKDDCDGDSWYDLPASEQWDLGIKELLKNEMLRISPNNWNEYYFGNGLTAFDFFDDYFSKSA